MASNSDIKRRLRVLEGVLGIDLDLSPCSGDPTNCTVDPCDETQCPMRNNLVNEMAGKITHTEQEATFFRHVVQELASQGDIDPTIVEVATLRMKEEGILNQISEVEVVLLSNPGSKILQEQMKELEAKLGTVRQKLQVVQVKEAKV